MRSSRDKEWLGLEWEPVDEPAPYPSWVSCDSEHYRSRLDGRDIIAKSVHEQLAPYLDVDAWFAAMQLAAGLGIGPRVVHVDVDARVIITEKIDAIRGTLPRITKGTRLSDVARAFDALAVAETVLPDRTIETDLSVISAGLDALNFRYPASAESTLAKEAEIVAALRSRVGLTTGWGDGNVSNILITEASGTLLTGGSRAGRMDPLQTTGSLLTELALVIERPEREVFVQLSGRVDERGFSRAKLFGILDDVRWAKWSWLVERVLGGVTGASYSSYGSFRIRKAELAIAADDFATTLENAREESR